MGTKGTRSSGSQFNPKGVTQGNTLVDPNTGRPIDVVTDTQGTRRLAVDANISIDSTTINVDLDYNDDSVQVGDPNTGSTLKINADGSIDTNVQIDASGGDNIAIKDSDGDELQINPDGSINVNATGSGASSPAIGNIVMTMANTEYSYAFPANTKRFIMRVRGTGKLQFSFVAGQTATNYMTLFPGSVHEEAEINISSTTVYFQNSKANEVVEILSWS